MLRKTLIGSAHGTHSGYVKGCRCAACTSAQNQYHRDRYRQLVKSGLCQTCRAPVTTGHIRCPQHRREHNALQREFMAKKPPRKKTNAGVKTVRTLPRPGK